MHSARVSGPTPMAIGRAISAPPLLPLARLGHIGATAQHCSFRGGGGQGAAARDRLVRSPPGLGKTREAVEWAIAYQTEQAGKGGTRLSVGDFNQAVVPAQTSTRAKSSPQALCAPGVPSDNGG